MHPRVDQDLPVDKTGNQSSHAARQPGAQLLKAIAGLSGACVVVVAGGHLLAWLTGAMAKRGVGAITMKTNTALCLLLLASALLLLANRRVQTAARRLTGSACAGIALVIGALTLSENLVGWNLGIDQLLATEAPGAMGMISPNRMGSPASLSVVLLGSALLLYSRQRAKDIRLEQGLALGACIVGLLPTIGYLYGVEWLYGLARISTIAWPTALSILALAVGLLCARPSEGLLAQVAASDAGGTVVRRLLLPVVLLPIALGGLHIAGQQLGWFDARMGTALLALTFVLSLTSVTWLAGRRGSRAAAELGAQQEALRESEERFRLALRHAPVSVAAQNRDLKYIWAYNQRTAPPGGVIGLRDDEIFTREEAEHITAVKRRVLEEGVDLRDQMWLAGPSGRVFLDICWEPLRDEAGRVIGVTSATVDLTARKLTEDALRLSEEKFARAFRGNTSGMAITRLRDGVFIDVNDRHLAMTGFTRDQLIGKSSAELDIWQCPEQRVAFVAQLRERGEVRNREYQIRRPDGTEWSGLVSAELSEIAGEPVIISSMADITERKRQERRVDELSRLYAVLSKVNETIVRTRDPIVLYQDVCRIIAEDGQRPLVWIGLVDAHAVKPVAVAGSASDYMQGLRVETDGEFGRGPSGTSIREGRPVVNDDFDRNPSTQPWREAALRHNLRASAALPIRHQGAVIGALTLYANEPGTFDREQVRLLEALSADVSYALDKMWQEQVLHESEQRFRAMADDSPIPIWVTDTTGQLEFVNRAYTGFFGVSMEEVQSGGWQPLIHPDDAPAYVGGFVAALRDRAPFRAQARVRHADGGWRWVDSHGIARFSASGEFLGIAGSSPDVTERMELERRLREKAGKLEEANRLKDDFLATLSHELRTPMSAIVGWAQMLATRKMDEAAVERGLQSILRNSQAQMQLITDMLDVSRIVSGRLRLNVGPIDLAAVVYAAVDTVRTAADAKGIQLTTRISTTATVVQGDADRLQQIVWNLLSNSVKFTPSGGSVCVSLQRTRSQLAVRVQDSGIGIAPAFLPHVFERFSQEETSTKRRHGGLGLGLSIVRHLVELHGGTVEAESDGEGQGSTFTVRLPIRAVVRTKAENERAQGSEAATPVEAFPSLSGVRILVVDDEADARELIRTVLSEFGATVRVAASAAEGLACLLEEPVDALVTDVGMPEEDGYDFVRELRSLPNAELRAIPAVALTAYGRAADAARALASGFHVHLTKPVEPEALVSTIARLVRGLEAT